MASSTSQELFDLTGRVALVTGDARSLGLDMAMALAEAGSDMGITSRSLESARKSVVRIAADTDCKAVGFACDVRFEGQVETMVDAVLTEFGRISILVNNAGNVVRTPDNRPLEQCPLKEWEFTVDTNMKGVFLCSKHVVAKAMKPAIPDVIINVGSVAGMAGKDHRVYVGTDMGGVTIDYAASKGGVINMTREMACYLAQYSYLVPMGRMGQDGKEMNGVVVFLASEASSYVTGINLPVDGGMMAW